MRVLNWALDAQKTVGGKIISVILSVALIFSFSNFFYGDNAFADTEEDTKSELVDQVSDKPAEENSEVVVPAKQTEQKPAAKAATLQATYATLDEFHAACEAMGDATDTDSVLAVLKKIEDVYNRLSDSDKAAVADEWANVKAYADQVRAGNSDEGVETLEITGPKKVTEGKTITLSSDKGSKNHKWSSSDTTKATVNGSGKSATVTGISVSEEPVTITHTWGNGWNAGSETFTVNVIAASYPVYVYAMIEKTSNVTENDANALIASKGIELNGNEDGVWYTLGEIANAITTAPGSSLGQFASESDKASVISKTSIITRFNGNSFPLNVVSEWTMKTSEGANDYPDAQGTPGTKWTSEGQKDITVTWHLDGIAKIVKYTWLDEVTNGELQAKADWAAPTAAVLPQNPTPASHEGYTFKEWNSSTNDEGDVTLTAIYTTDIKYQANAGGKVSVASEEVTARGDAQGSVATADTGYHFVNWTDANGNVVSTDASFIPAKVNGLNVPATYTANFTINNYTLTTKADDHSTISQGANYDYDATATNEVTFSANEGYTITGITVDGAALADDALASAVEAGKVTLDKKADHSVEVTTTINNYGYTVEYYADGNKLAAQEGWATGDKAEYQSKVTITPDTTATIDGVNYMLESTNHEIASISEDASKNVIRVDYTKDSIGTTDPTQPDNVADKYQATIQYVSADENGTVSGTTQRVITLMNGEEYATSQNGVIPGTNGVVLTPATGYVFFGWDTNPDQPIYAEGGKTYVYTANWTEDTVGTDPTNPDQGDGIPDMYQARVDFAANNGTVNIGHTYVTLLDANGNPAVNGTGYLQQAQIPTATANDGFDQASLAWDTTPTAQVAITGAMTFTANFTAIPAPAPTPTPAPAPAPATPAAAPAAPAAAPAAPAVVIPDDENPLAAPEQEIADDENPLAAFDHEECWVHWFMIAGIILTIIYGAVVVLRRTRNTKHIDKMEKDLIGTTDESTVTVGSAHHSHA